jgi:polyferredoxin/NAD-dependent dihydropyrimidine dehydrogenase PreA subunit
MDYLKEKTLGLTTQAWRRISQVLFLLALNPFLWRFLPGNAPEVLGACAPVLNCWSCPAAALACPIGAVGQFLVRGLVPVLALGTMLLAGVLFGRIFCGWVCPFGFLQDLLHKIPTRMKFRPPHGLRHLKYVVAVVTVILIPLFFGIDGGFDRVSGYFFCSWCPAGTLEATIPIRLQMAVDPGSTTTLGETLGGFLASVKFWILAAFLLSFVYFQRPFCKIACPIGAFLGLFNKVSFFRYGRRRHRCADCRVCRDICPEIPDVDISADPPDCIRCYVCAPSPCEQRWVVETTPSACKECALCYQFCPSGVLARGADGKPRVLDPEKCSGCGMCALRCPELGIRVRPADPEFSAQGAVCDPISGEGRTES